MNFLLLTRVISDVQTQATTRSLARPVIYFLNELEKIKRIVVHQ